MDSFVDLCDLIKKHFIYEVNDLGCLQAIYARTPEDLAIIKDILK